MLNENGYLLHVHLITVEVGIVWRCHGKIEAESFETMSLRYHNARNKLTGIWHQLDSMAHHTHFVQRRLSIEEHKAIEENN